MESLITCVIWGYTDFIDSDIKLKCENNHCLWKAWADSL